MNELATRGGGGEGRGGRKEAKAKIKLINKFTKHG